MARLRRSSGTGRARRFPRPPAIGSESAHAQPVSNGTGSKSAHGLRIGSNRLKSAQNQLIDEPIRANSMSITPTDQEMCERIIGKAELVRNAAEAAFFLWTNLAYLQPFEDGNKRTSRLAANIPLMLYNCAPLSFLNVEQSDYASAMMGIYELNDASIAIDLFEWTYRRSITKYRVVLESMGAPNPLRLRYRGALTDAIGLIVRVRKTASAAMEELGLNENVAPGFQALLDSELAMLEVFNYARYRLTKSATAAWIEAGRPR